MLMYWVTQTESVRCMIPFCCPHRGEVVMRGIWVCIVRYWGKSVYLEWGWSSRCRDKPVMCLPFVAALVCLFSCLFSSAATLVLSVVPPPYGRCSSDHPVPFGSSMADSGCRTSRNDCIILTLVKKMRHCLFAQDFGYVCYPPCQACLSCSIRPKVFSATAPCPI